jgi:hypothetical protein
MTGLIIDEYQLHILITTQHWLQLTKHPSQFLENILLSLVELLVKSPSVSPLSPLLSPNIPSFGGSSTLRKFD